MIKLTFTSQHRIVPDHIPFLQDAGDGFCPVGPDEALVAQEGHRAAKLEAVTKPLPIHWHARVRTFIVPKC